MALPELSDQATSLDVTGSNPDVSESTLEAKNRTITSVSQAHDVCYNLEQAWRKGIKHSARITAKLNGERPYDQSKLKAQGKDWKTNISTGFLSTECSKIVPRFYMPIKSAQYLTAAQLPQGWAGGTEKTEYFREVVTEAIRGWKKWNFFLRGISREAGIFGFGFATYFDEFEWRPNLVRMDKGFVPQGTEIMEYDFPFYCVKWDYKPEELLSLLKRNEDAGLTYWKKDSTVAAINAATMPPAQTIESESRTFEELIRQANACYSYSKGVKVISVYHLFAQEADGKISHYIILRDTPTGDEGLLYERLDAYNSMDDVAVPMVFEYGDGTIQGCWGAGQILFDMAVQVEKIRNDSIDNLRNSNKIKVTVPEAKNINDVKLAVTDTMMIVSNATFSGNVAALSQEADGYMALDQQFSQLAQQKIGAYVPPIPLQPSDIKAAQVNAAMMQEQEIQQSLLDNWLSQFAHLVGSMVRRMLNKDTPDIVGIATREKLLLVLSEEEIDMLVNQPVIQTITDFTPFTLNRKAAFAQSVLNNPLFNQHNAALAMATAAGGTRFTDFIVNPGEDPTNIAVNQNKQTLENTTLATGVDVQILPTDNDWVHMQTMKQPLIMVTQQATQNGNTKVARTGLKHYAAHYESGVQKKGIPKEQINPEKSFIAQVEKALDETDKKVAEITGGPIAAQGQGLETAATQPGVA